MDWIMNIINIIKNQWIPEAHFAKNNDSDSVIVSAIMKLCEIFLYRYS